VVGLTNGGNFFVPIPARRLVSGADDDDDDDVDDDVKPIIR